MARAKHRLSVREWIGLSPIIFLIWFSAWSSGLRVDDGDDHSPSRGDSVESTPMYKNEGIDPVDAEIINDAILQESARLEGVLERMDAKSRQLQRASQADATQPKPLGGVHTVPKRTLILRDPKEQPEQQQQAPTTNDAKAESVRQAEVEEKAGAGTYEFKSTQMRAWNDITGGFSVRARLKRLEQERVTLIKEDGKEISVPLERLSVQDREYVAVEKELVEFGL